MAHEIDMTNGRANFAFVGETAWHGLGHELEPGASLETWAEIAGLSHTVESAPVLFEIPGGTVPFDGRTVLYRSDNSAPLSVVSDDYQILQPRDVLEFYRDLVDASGMFTLETAGSLHGGKKVWAMAKSKLELKIGTADIVLPYLFLATSYDGSMATTGKFTTVRVVCQNTLNMADRGNGAAVRIPHSTKFDPDAVKAELGLIETRAAEFERRALDAAAIELAPDDALDYFATIFGNEPGVLGSTPELDELPKPRRDRIERAVDAYATGPGADMKGSRGTLWGAVNAVTYLVDHEGTSKSDDANFSRAQFGDGAQRKAAAWELAGNVIDAARHAGKELAAAQ